MPILLGRLTEGMVWMTWRICCPPLPCVDARMEPGDRTAGMAEVELRPEGEMETVVGAGRGGATSKGEDCTEAGAGGGGAEAAAATLDLLRERSTGSAWGCPQSLASSSSGGSVLMSASSTGGSRGPSASSADELMAGVAFPGPCKTPAGRERTGKLRHGAGEGRAGQEVLAASPQPAAAALPRGGRHGLRGVRDAESPRWGGAGAGRVGPANTTVWPSASRRREGGPTPAGPAPRTPLCRWPAPPRPAARAPPRPSGRGGGWAGPPRGGGAPRRPPLPRALTGPRRRGANPPPPPAGVKRARQRVTHRPGGAGGAPPRVRGAHPLRGQDHAPRRASPAEPSRSGPGRAEREV